MGRAPQQPSITAKQVDRTLCASGLAPSRRKCGNARVARKCVSAQGQEYAFAAFESRTAYIPHRRPVIRADYDKSSVEIELVNVRRPGRARCRLESKTLDDVVDDLARYVLGVDDDFGKILNRR